MYSIEEKEEIIEMLKNGASVSELHEKYGIAKSKLYEWYEEVNIRKKINNLRASNKPEEAKKQAKKLKGKYAEPIKNSILAGMAREEENIEEEKGLLQRLLEIEPNNVKAINSLIRIAREEGDVAEEKRLLQRLLEIEPNNVKVISRLIKIVREEGDVAEEKRLLQRLLEIDHYNVKSISSLMRIAREEGNIPEEKRLLQRRLEIVPNDVKAMSSLIRIAREEGDIAEEKRLQQRLLEIDPDNVKAMSSLIRIAREDGDVAEEKRLLQRLLEIDPDNVKAIRSLKKIVSDEKKKKFKEKTLRVAGNEQGQLNPVEEARRLIYESEDTMKGAEEIKVLLEGESQTNSTLILAELYFHTGMAGRAEKLLKAYKKTLDKNTQLRDIRLVNQAIELSRNTKTQSFKWNEFWTAKKERETPETNMENNPDKNKKTSPSAPGEDGDR